jgi:predicted NACHT family NTPase
VSLRDFRFLSFTAADLTSLTEFISRSSPALADNLRPRDLQGLLGEGRCVIVFDGLDELGNSGPRVVREINRLVADYPLNRYIVTRRTQYYFSYAQLPGFDAYEVMPWSQAEITDYFSKALHDPEDAQYLVEHLPALSSLTSPLLANLVLETFSKLGRVPTTRIDLLGSAFELMLGKWDSIRGLEGAALPRAEMVKGLSHLALDLLRQGRSVAHREEILDHFSHGNLGPESVNNLLRRIEERSGLLVESLSGGYGFSHKTFQEYLAALAIVDIGELSLGGISLYEREPVMREPLVLAVGLLGRADLPRAIGIIMHYLYRDDGDSLLFGAECAIEIGLLHLGLPHWT